MKIGLIGCGKQAWKHIAGLKSESDVEVAVCDINAERARDVGEKFDIPWSDDVGAFLADPALDAVNIATPTTTHAELVSRAIDAGKHFFCEKPLCNNIEDARRIQRDVEAKQLIGMVGYVYRHSPVFETAFELGPHGGSGQPLGAPVTAQFRIGGRGDHEIWKHRLETSGGAVSEMLVHMLDLAIWYFGPAVDAAMLARDLLRPVRRIGGIDVEVDAEDFALARIDTESGVRAWIQADLLSPAFSQYVEIQYERGSFMGSIQGDFPSFVFANEDSGAWARGKNPLAFGSVNLFERQMATFCAHVREGRALTRNTVGDSLKMMEALELLRTEPA